MTIEGALGATRLRPNTIYPGRVKPMLIKQLIGGFHQLLPLFTHVIFPLKYTDLST
ncbi:hypothetical protein D3C72_2502090 [compost metagenome]